MAIVADAQEIPYSNAVKRTRETVQRVQDRANAVIDYMEETAEE